MELRKEDLREAYDKSISGRYKGDGFADNVMMYSIGILIASGIVNAILISSIEVTGVIIGILVQIGAIYLIVLKLFENVDKLVVDRIDRREKELLESLEEE